MLVYAATLWLRPDASRDTILTVVARWLASKTKTPVTAKWLVKTGDPRMRDGSRVSVIAKADVSPELWAMRYAHPDADTAGRQWVTEVGLRRDQPGAAVECSVMVQTSEISARVTSPVRASRPTLVSAFDNEGLLITATPGRRVRILSDDPDTAEAFLYGVEDETRRFPYVLVSPDAEGKYLIDQERLRSLLVGLADVVVIAPEADTYALSRLLGRHYAAWRGAVNILFPQVQFPDRAFVEARRLLPEEIADLRARGVEPESEVLSVVTHRTNLPASWRAISPARVQEAVLRAELSKRLEEAKNKDDLEGMRELINEIDVKQRQEIETLEKELDATREELSLQRDVERRLRYELHQATQDDTDAPEKAGLDESARNSILAALDRSATPEQALVVMSSLFDDRLVILPSAWKSVRASEGFKDSDRICELLRKLATDYWQSMRCGKGDIEAGRVFGTAYAARESETVESNPQARKRRTFLYDGQSVPMMRHLKISRKESKAATLRIHFHWDAKASKVVVGHCGPHLDFD